MKKFLTFVTVAGIMILASGCEVHTRTVYVPKKGSTTVVQATPASPPSTTVVVYEQDPYEDPYIEDEIVIVYEPSYTDYCDSYNNGWEECCYGYTVDEVWLNPHEYVYEVCEYTQCVDHWHDVLTENTVNCWYE